MLDPEAQAEVLRQIADAAAKHGLIVAPVGSVFFLFEGQRRALTKDIDVVVHLDDRSIVSLEVLRKLGSELGEVEEGEDKSIVTVTMEGSRGPVKIDLLRGREGAKKGFLPRDLLRAAARGGRQEGNILWYPPEFVILLKADAAADRSQRAAKGGPRAEENRQRAEIFQQDVFAQVESALGGNGLKEEYLVEGLLCLKKARRIEVASVIEAASGGRLHLTERVR